MMNLISLMDPMLFQISKNILNRLLKKHETIASNTTVQIYVNRIKNRIVFKIKTNFKLEQLSPKTQNY